MKKLLLFIFLIFPLIVNADDSSLSLYNAKVTNKNGITYESWSNGTFKKKTIPYQSDIIVSYQIYKYYDENTHKNTTYESLYGYHNKESFSIDMKDIAINKDSFICNECAKNIYINDVFTNNEAKNIKILNPKGLVLKNGPAEDFSSSDTIIPFNSEVKVNYIIGTGGMDDDYYYWANVYYKGAYGFINVHNPDNAFYSTDLIYITTDKINITFNNRIIGSIPANTIISPSYTDNSYSKFYLTYNDLTGFIDGDKLSYGNNTFSKLMIKYDHSLLSIANPKSKSLLTIPANTILEYRFTLYDESQLKCIYTEYQNKIGWVCFDKGEIPKHIFNDNNNQTTTTTKKVQNYEIINDNKLNLLLISTFILFIGIIITIITKNRIIQKNNERYIESISHIEEDTDDTSQK